MAIPNGFGTVSCSKEVPGGAKDLVLCTETKKAAGDYTRVKGVETSCRDPNAAAPPVEQNKDDDEDDEALVKQLQKQGQDFIDQQKKK